MRKSKFPGKQIARLLAQSDAGDPIAVLC